MKTRQIQFVLVAFLMATMWQSCKKDVAPDPAPTADFSFAQSSGGTIQFTDKSFSGRTYAWDFGNGTTSIEQNPKVVYANNGDYTVKLTVKNNNTGQNSVEKIVTTIVDVNVMSNTADTWIKLYNSLGQSLNYIDLSRTPFQIQKLQKGTYTMLLGADFATKTDYTLEINGKVEKLVEKVAAVLKISDKWSANLVTTDGRDYSFDNYAFDVTEDNTWIEVVATSADVENRTNVYDSGGVDVSSAPYFTDKVKRQTFKASKGKYKIYLRSAGKSTAAYNLLVVGQVANLKKL